MRNRKVALPRKHRYSNATWPSPWVGEDFYQHGALTGAVEFAQENPLPGSESEFSVLDEDGLTGTGEDGLHVRVGVALGVLITALVRNKAIENSFDVARDVGIGMFVDGNSGSAVRNIDVANAAFHSGFADSLFHLASDVYKLGAAIRFDVQSLHCCGDVMGWG